MNEHPPIIVAEPVHVGVEPFVEGSDTRWCTVCGIAVRVSPHSLRMIEEQDAQLVCTLCGPGLFRTAPGKLMPPSPEQRAELRAAGATDADIDAAYADMLKVYSHDC